MLQIQYEDSTCVDHVIVEFYKSLRKAKDAYKLHHYEYCERIGEDLDFEECKVIEGNKYSTTNAYENLSDKYSNCILGIIMSIKF